MSRKRRSRPTLKGGTAQGSSSPNFNPTSSVAAAAAAWEPSQWLRSAVARRLEYVDQVIAAAGVLGVDVVRESRTLVQLVPSTPGAASDRTCDRCGVYVHPRGDYSIEAISPPNRWDVRIIVGLCRRCAHWEGWC